MKAFCMNSFEYTSWLWKSDGGERGRESLRRLGERGCGAGLVSDE